MQGLVWKPWLEKGYELAVTPVPDARKQDSLVRGVFYPVLLTLTAS